MYVHSDPTKVTITPYDHRCRSTNETFVGRKRVESRTKEISRVERRTCRTSRIFCPSLSLGAREEEEKERAGGPFFE